MEYNEKRWNNGNSTSQNNNKNVTKIKFKLIWYELLISSSFSSSVGLLLLLHSDMLIVVARQTERVVLRNDVKWLVNIE